LGTYRRTLNKSDRCLTLYWHRGDLAIGGALDASRRASGRGASVTNANASIEALGNLSISAARVNNLNNRFSTELRVTNTEWVTEYSTNNSPTHYSSDSGMQVIADRDDPNISLLRVAGSDYETWAHYDFTRSTKETVITSSDPGRIAAGGNLSISADGVLNDNSHILAGGFIGIAGPLTNTETPGGRITSEFGTATDVWRIHNKGTDDQGTATSVYAPPDIIESILVKDSRVDEQAASLGGSVPGMTAAGGVTGSTSSAGKATATVNAGAIVKVSTSAGPVNAASGNDASSASAADGPTGTDRGDGSARLAAIGSAIGEQATVSAPGGQASSADPMQVGFSSRLVAVSEVGRTAGLAGQDRTAAVSALPQGAIDPATGLHVSTATGSTGAESAAISPPATPGVNAGHPSGAGVGSAGGIDPSGRAQAPGVTQSALEQTAGGVKTVRTSTPSSQLPGASLFQVDPSPSAGYLVETDPRFANYQQWTGSDYMLAQSKLDPAMTQKRLGDGFYEQKLVRDQVAQLTGQRFLGDYASDDEQYRGLMDAGIEYAKELNLRPGVALTAEQMGALTRDMVWLVAQEVTLVDGTVQKVLAPQVYVASFDKDLTGAGAVISGRDVKVASTGDLTNTGSIFARNTAQLVADNINNLGGRIHADSVLASAKTDINNIAGTISAGHELIATAGRDINVATTTRSASSAVDGNHFSRTTIDRVGSLAVTGAGGTLAAIAGRDINLVAAKIDNAGKDGNTLLNAGRNVNLATVTTASSNAVRWDLVRYRNESSSTEVGTVIQGAGAITFKAGTDINLRAASVDAGKDLTAIAGNNLNILAGVSTSKFDQTSQTSKSGFLHHETITTRNTFDGTSAVGSVLGGATVNLAAGNDLKVVT
jgi:filamentous hemagglutinin